MKRKEEQLGIMGGTFNPIHHGHLIAARAAKERLGLDRLLLLPNARSPLRMEEALADPEDRLEMVRLAVEEESGLEACDLEVRREGASFLVETLAELQGLYPDATLTFLMGVDSLDTFDRWREVDRIVSLAQVKVMPRPGRAGSEALTALEARAPSLAGKVSLMPAGPQVEISATEVRQRIASGQSIRYLLPDAVVDYVVDHGIYGA
ncbi:nicotinate-nucleotide adenylyltransferase [Kiritimatiellota bacterium B12222]|nr:nicotinate-nucleotide adenylyltransferase [Kiritimatiellota bacterium B12222]